MVTVNIDGVAVEIPRLVKKPGEYLRVDTEQALRDALKDGWVLRLPTAGAKPHAPETPGKTAKTGRAGRLKAGEPLVEAPETPEQTTTGGEEGTASEPDAERAAQPKVKKKPGRKPKAKDA
jgi:hypothetical protein